MKLDYIPTQSPDWSFDQLKKSLEPNYQKMNEILHDAIQSPVPLANAITISAIKGVGKHLRPIMVMAGATLGEVGATPPLSQRGTTFPCLMLPESTLFLAAAVELIHGATLLHDDVLDEAMIRRNQPSGLAKWGRSLSILGGDFLFAQAFSLMVKAQNLEILGILAHVSKKIVEGEIHQAQEKANLSLTMEAYLNIITQKTASLFAASIKIGGLSRSFPLEILQQIEDFGLNFGIYYQILDDINDYDSSFPSYNTKIMPNKLKGNDLKEKKITLPLMILYHQAPSEEKDYLQSLMDAPVISAIDHQHVLQLMNRGEILSKALHIAKTFGRQAQNALNTLPDHQDSMVKRWLITMVDELPAMVKAR